MWFHRPKNHGIRASFTLLCDNFCNFNVSNLVPRGRDPFGQRRGSQPLAFTAVKRLGIRAIWALPVPSGDPSGHFPAMECSIKFIDFNTLRNKLCVSLRMSYWWASFCSLINHYFMPNHVWMKSFMALTGKEGNLFELNYHDKNTRLHVSLRTRKFDKKIHYCCRYSFFVEKDI